MEDLRLSWVKDVTVFVCLSVCGCMCPVIMMILLCVLIPGGELAQEVQEEIF